MKPLDEVLNDLEVRNHEFRIKIILTFYRYNPRNFIHYLSIILGRRVCGFDQDIRNGK